MRQPAKITTAQERVRAAHTNAVMTADLLRVRSEQTRQAPIAVTAAAHVIETAE